MKSPPFLLPAALLFWGWQSGFLPVAAVLAALIELPRWIRFRADLADRDFGRIWTFCSLVLLGCAVVAFTSGQGPAEVRDFFQRPSFQTQRAAGMAGERTAAEVMRWLPMIYFLFLCAQLFSERQGVPLETMSAVLQIRWRRARPPGQPAPAARLVDVSHAYLGLCLFSAGIHPAENAGYFWGLAVLVTWALWPRRSHRFGPGFWLPALAVAVGLGYGGQRGIGALNHYLGNFNPAWLLNFGRRGFDHAQSKLMFGQIGRIQGSGGIVIRVQPTGGRMPPPLLREASYRNYHGQFWLSGFQEKDFERVDPARDNPGETTFVLLPMKAGTSAASISCYLPGGKGLLPLPPGTTRLDNLVAFTLVKSPLGAVLETGPGMVIFDATYGPGATIDSPPEDVDKLVPMRELGPLDVIIGEAGLAGKPLDETMPALQRFFERKFAYSLFDEGGSVTGTNETQLGRFLLGTRHGHCEYFATATALILRRLGFPARYAVGYSVHEPAQSGFVVRQRDAHAWCLVWRNGAWEDYDTTPATWFSAEAARASRLEWLRDVFSRLRWEFSKFRWGQSGIRQYLLWALVPVLGLLLYQILARIRRRKTSGADPGSPPACPGLDSEVYALERLLAARGLARQGGEPLGGWLRRAAGPGTSTSLRPVLEEVIRLHYRYRFDPRGLDGVERNALRELATQCARELAAGAPLLARQPPPAG